jgi:hypothetical protein
MTTVFSGPMGEYDGHGVFEHSKRHGTEKQHKQNSDDTHKLAACKKAPHLTGYTLRIRGDYELQIAEYGVIQLFFFEKMRQPHQDERQHGYYGQKGIVGNRPGEQQSLIAFKANEHSPQEFAGAL